MLLKGSSLISTTHGLIGREYNFIGVTPFASDIRSQPQSLLDTERCTEGALTYTMSLNFIFRRVSRRENPTRGVRKCVVVN